jgi:hypothetical protein
MFSGFQVTVHQALSMRGVERGTHATQNVEHFRAR